VNGLTDTEDGSPAAVSIAAIDGHQYDGKIYAVESTGKIIAIDFRTKKLHHVGRISPSAAKAEQAIVAWDGASMSVLYLNESTALSKLEKYNLTSGKLESSIEVHGLAKLISKSNRLCVPVGSHSTRIGPATFPTIMANVGKRAAWAGGLLRV
jgi:hypothetical protein